MFRVSLSDLQRVRSLEVQEGIGEDDPLWQGFELDFAGPVRVSLTVTRTPSGQVLASGRVEAALRFECRRCLEAVELELEHSIQLLWTVADGSPTDPAPDPDARLLEPKASHVEIGEAVREELVLAAPRYVLCSEDCSGLCPQCGVNRNEEDCDCSAEERDPRWDALRALNN